MQFRPFQLLTSLADLVAKNGEIRLSDWLGIVSRTRTLRFHRLKKKKKKSQTPHAKRRAPPKNDVFRFHQPASKRADWLKVKFCVKRGNMDNVSIRA